MRSEHKRRGTAGVSLLELLAAIAIGGILVWLGIGAFGRMTKGAGKAAKAAEDETNRRTLRNSLTATLSTALQGDVYVSPSLFNYLGLGWYGVTEGAATSLFVAPATTVGPAGAAAAAPAFQALIVFHRDRRGTPLNLTTETILTDAQAADGSLVTLPVTGNTGPYQAGDLVTLQTPAGVEFVVVNQVGAGQLVVQVKADSGLPIKGLPAGTQIFRAEVVLIGGLPAVPISTFGIYRLQAGGALAAVSSFPFELPLNGVAVQRQTNPANPTSWVSAPRSAIPAVGTDYLLRLSWQRPTTVPGAGAQQINTLDVAL